MENLGEREKEDILENGDIGSACLTNRGFYLKKADDDRHEGCWDMLSLFFNKDFSLIRANLISFICKNSK